jgi:hypothetical protein
MKLKGMGRGGKSFCGLNIFYKKGDSPGRWNPLVCVLYNLMSPGRIFLTFSRIRQKRVLRRAGSRK